MPTFWRFHVTGDKISRIDTGRVEILREALRRGISPERDGRLVHRRESVVI